MNRLFLFANVERDGLPDFAWHVFLAFDEGEFVRPDVAEDQQQEALTRKLLAALL